MWKGKSREEIRGKVERAGGPEEYNKTRREDQTDERRGEKRSKGREERRR